MSHRVLIFCALSFLFSSQLLAQGKKILGIDSNYALQMSEQQKQWKWQSASVELLPLFARQGCQDARIRLWVGDDGVNQLHYATRTAQKAQQAGLKPCLVIFLSEDWADFVKQPAPAVWKNLSPQQKLETIEAYAQRVVQHFSDQGVSIDTFEIGNEIDFGICGEFEEQWPRRVSLDYMRQQIWPRMIPIIKAAQAGVLKVQPRAKFILHLSQWNHAEYCSAFFQAMIAANVQLDLAGLSYFPSSVEKNEQQTLEYLRANVAKIVEAIHRPVLICESGYPAQEHFSGQFAGWNHAAAGYPLNEKGQAKWIADLVTLVRRDANFAGLFYWSPEWFDGGLWDAFALFDADGNARPGVASFENRE